MNFKKYHVSRNLLDKTGFTDVGATIEQIEDGIRIITPSGGYAARIVLNVLQNTNYTVSYIYKKISGSGANAVKVFAGTGESTEIVAFYSKTGGTFNTGNNTKINIWFYASFGMEAAVEYTNIMFNEGSQPLPYEPYSSEVWHDITHYIHNTSTDTITTLPTVIYPNDTSITVGLKGNTGGVGDLVESGEHAGEYVIPIVCDSVITNIYRNAPLDISDSLATSIPCTAGENSFDVQTTVQPSEVTANYRGWHPVADVHERDNGAWT